MCRNWPFVVQLDQLETVRAFFIKNAWNCWPNICSVDNVCVFFFVFAKPYFVTFWLEKSWRDSFDMDCSNFGWVRETHTKISLIRSQTSLGVSVNKKGKYWCGCFTNIWRNASLKNNTNEVGQYLFLCFHLSTSTCLYKLQMNLHWRIENNSMYRELMAARSVALV